MQKQLLFLSLLSAAIHILPAHISQDLLAQEKYPHAYEWLMETKKELLGKHDQEVFITIIPNSYANWASGFTTQTAFLFFSSNESLLMLSEFDLELIRKFQQPGNYELQPQIDTRLKMNFLTCTNKT